MNEFDAHEMDEQCDEDNADLGSALHDEVYSKGLATLATLGTATSTLDRDYRESAVEPPSHTRPAKMIQDVLDKSNPAKMIRDILDEGNPANAIRDILDEGNPANAIRDILDEGNPANAIQDILDKRAAAKLINTLLSRAELSKLLESTGSDSRTPAQTESRPHQPSGTLEDLLRKLKPFEIPQVPVELELPKHETPWPPVRQPGIAIPLAKKN